MCAEFINDDDVINNISDDGIYLRELVKRERNSGLNKLKEAHLGRMVTVFSYNSLEAYRDVVVRKVGLNNKGLPWVKFLTDSELTPIFERIVKSEPIKLGSLQTTLATLEGLKALRDFISHGLTDDSANAFEKKMEALKKARLLKNPTKLNIEDVDRILEFESSVTSLIGMGRALLTNERRKLD